MSDAVAVPASAGAATAAVEERAMAKAEGSVAAALAKCSLGAYHELEDAEIRKLVDSCFTTPASGYEYPKQGPNRPFQEACAATKGGQRLRRKTAGTDRHYVSGDSHASSLDNVKHLDVIHFPVDNCVENGNLYVAEKTGLPGQVSMRSLGSLKVNIAVLGYGIPPDEAQELMMSSFAMMDAISVTADPYLHSDKSKKAEYAAFEERYLADSLMSIGEIAEKCPNLTTLTVHGYAMCEALVNFKPLHSPAIRRLLEKYKRCVTNQREMTVPAKSNLASTLSQR